MSEQRRIFAAVYLAALTTSSARAADLFVGAFESETRANFGSDTGSLALIPGCNTAAVVGFTWSASTVNTGGLSVAGYRIARGGAIIATIPLTQTSYQDTSVIQSTAYNYTVTAFYQAGNTSAASTLNTTTAAKSATGDAPYCQSTKITGMSFDFLNVKSEANGNGGTTASNGATPTSSGGFDKPPYTDGSDLWAPTCAADGNTYIFFGDGWGLCGREDTGSTMANDQTSFGIGKMTGYPSAGHCPPEWSNTYGGANSSRPNGGWTESNLTSNNGLLLGKVSSIVAVGNDFYGFGAAWRSGDSSNYLNGGHGPPKSGPNNHLEVIASTGSGNNAAAWVDSTTDLCNARPPARCGVARYQSVRPRWFNSERVTRECLRAWRATYISMPQLHRATWATIPTPEPTWFGYRPHKSQLPVLISTLRVWTAVAAPSGPATAI